MNLAIKTRIDLNSLDLSMKRKLWIYITFGIILCLGVGLLASIATQVSVNTWYQTLEKPFFTPPSWLFGPVWSLLYILMGIALGRVIFFITHDQLDKIGLYYFGGQLLINGLWSFIFFGLSNPILGLLVIVILLFLILRTIKWFRAIDRLSAQILYPYFIWVIFATLLNAAIVFLN
jgi:tryptophan-rich sensory protein